LVILLCVTAFRIGKELRSGATYAVMRYVALTAAVVANFSESYFARMAPVGFLFILAAVEVPRRRNAGLRTKDPFADSVQRQAVGRLRESAPLGLGTHL